MLSFLEGAFNGVVIGASAIFALWLIRKLIEATGVRIRPRFIPKFLAWTGGYFWLPCPICKEDFAGFEWPLGGESIMTSNSAGTGVCGKPECQAEARRRNVDAGYPTFSGMTTIRLK